MKKLFIQLAVTKLVVFALIFAAFAFPSKSGKRYIVTNGDKTTSLSANDYYPLQVGNTITHVNPNDSNQIWTVTKVVVD